MIKVLIIEDEIQLLHNLASYLTSFKEEFEVLTAPSGEEGLALLDGHPDVSVLLTDVRLPGMDGIEVVRRTVERRPEVRVVVMTAFGSPELRVSAETEGALRFVEKPIDLDVLPDVLRKVHTDRQRRSRAVGGLDILDVTQFVALARETKVIRFEAQGGEGTLIFENGTLVHCSTDKLSGADAFLEMALWGEGSFYELFDVETRRYRKNVDPSTTQLLEQATRLSEEIEERDPFETGAQPLPRAQQTSDRSPTGDPDEAITHETARQAASQVSAENKESQRGKESQEMAIKDHLAEFQDIEGFLGAAVFTAQGEMVDGVSKGQIDIKAIGMYANNALLNAQKATDKMGVGRGNLMQIRAPQATVLMRCLNEATDFAASKEGKAHFHTVIVLDPEGNSGMATLLLDKAVGKIAEDLR